MDRRQFLSTATRSGILIASFGILGCGKEPEGHWEGGTQRNFLTGTVVLYDTYAMALYMDGDLGPKTGILKVEYVIQNQPVTLPFWHGHGGKDHAFTITPEHFAQIKQLKKVTIETTIVQDHTHKLFIDPKDPKWRVPGAQPVEVPV